MVRRPLAVVLALGLLASGCGGDDDHGSAPTTTSEPPTTTVDEPRAFVSSVEEVTAEDLYASWRPGCPLPVEELRLLRVPHWGFDGEVHGGRIVVAADVVDDVLAVLADLYEARYPIERMEPVDQFGGSDEASMDANNTSGFNCRLATGGTGWSEHAYGRAVDVNPLQNPFVRGDSVLPPQSARYTDRSLDEPGMIREGDTAVTAFARVGWIWGGTWQTSKDYQHFSPSGR